MGELTAKAPAQAPWQRDLAVSYSKAGLDRLAQGDAGSARDEIRAGLAINVSRAPYATRLKALKNSAPAWRL